MNALVGVGANSTGFFSADPAKRQEAMKQIQSMLRARVLGADVEQSPVKSAAAATKSAAAGGVSTKAAEKKDSDSSDTSSVVNKELDRDAFLQLLVTQMQNQDPTAPMDNSQMIAQLAQFSSLEQMQNLNDSFTTLSGNVDQLNFMTANSLLGRKITGVDIEGDKVSGVVSQVQMDGSVVYLTVGEQLVSMAGVLVIEPPSTTTS